MVLSFRSARCIIFSAVIAYSCGSQFAENANINKKPTVTLAFVCRNVESHLAWFLGGIERLNYPKDRLSLWIYTDHNEDKTGELLTTWAKDVTSLYHRVNLTVGVQGRYADEKEEEFGEWTAMRIKHMINIRQEALESARSSWSDYLLMLDSDIFISDLDLLDHLIAEDRPIVAPLMNSSTLYSNFWGALSEKGYYKRSENYMSIVERHLIGTFEVPMVHSVFLVNLRHIGSDLLAYNYDNYNGSPDDIMQFAKSARDNSVGMYITNRHPYYGHLVPPISGSPSYLSTLRDHTLYIRLHNIHSGTKLEPSQRIPQPPPKYDKKLGFDEVYMINLERRPDRRIIMEQACAELGIEYKYFAAIDGRKLNDTYLSQIGVKQMEGYLDPYHKRPMKFGEIGCFLSHYLIWKEMEKKGYNSILILEDDVRFRLNFVKNFYDMMDEANRHINGWDLLYIGRKIMFLNEKMVPNSHHLVYPSYTYWTLSYALSRTGLEKLLAQNPISKMIPVDEFLPIMFDAHDNAEWKSHFPNRNLVALSANPLFVEPLKYIGQQGYVSDTEDSSVITQSKQQASAVELQKEKDNQDSQYGTSDSVNLPSAERQRQANNHIEL